MRRLSIQEQRSDLDDSPDAPFYAFCDDIDLEQDLVEVNDFVNDIKPNNYLWNSPWHEFDAPEWVNGRLGAVPGWWLPWAESR